MNARPHFFLILVATVLAAALCARLGFWQLDRAAQKEAKAAAISSRSALPPLQGSELAATPQSAESQLHRRVTLRGHWLADKTIFLDNRPMLGRAGFFVLTPLQLDGRADAVLVQRGWVPREQRDRSHLPPLDTPAGELIVHGRLTAAPSRLYEFSAAASGVIRQNLSVADYAQEQKLALLPLTVLQLGGTPADALARDWPAPDLGLQKHYGYAFQWFALCALLLGLYVWFQTIRPRLLARRAP